MTRQNPDDANELQTIESTGTGSKATDESTEQPSGNPLVEVFGPDIGTFQYGCHKTATSIGRAGESDIRLPHKSVSRVHATISREDDRFTLADAGSASGTFVDGQRIDSLILEDGDTIHIGIYVIQFFTHNAPSTSNEAASRAKVLLGAHYRLLPPSMRVRFRILDIDEHAIFNSGQTFEIGQSGWLIPTSESSIEGSCVELKLTTAGGEGSRTIGQIMGIIEGEGTHWMCVRNQMLSKTTHEEFVAASKPGVWTDALPT